MGVEREVSMIGICLAVSKPSMIGIRTSRMAAAKLLLAARSRAFFPEVAVRIR